MKVKTIESFILYFIYNISYSICIVNENWIDTCDIEIDRKKNWVCILKRNKKRKRKKGYSQNNYVSNR
jgi:hypothetical protein